MLTTATQMNPYTQAWNATFQLDAYLNTTYLKYIVIFYICISKINLLIQIKHVNYTPIAARI